MDRMKKLIVGISLLGAMNVAYADHNNDFTTAYYNNEFCKTIGNIAANALDLQEQYLQEPDWEKQKYARDDRYGEDGVYPTADAYLFDNGYIKKNGDPALPWYSDKLQDEELVINTVRFVYKYGTSDSAAYAYGYSSCMNIYGYMVDYYQQNSPQDGDGQ